MSPVSKRALLVALVAVVSSRLVRADELQGCYSNYDNGTRALPFLAMSGSTMSPALCSRMANARFAFAFGLEFGKECWLDPERGSSANLTRLGASTACNMACTGDSSSTCGGRYAVDLYTTDSTTWNQTLAETAFLEVGCYRDSQSRIMHKQLWVSSLMSTELCAHIAFAENWPIFGLQYGRECWASDDMTTAEQLGVLMADDFCQVPCSGNSTQTCGGSWAMQMYRFNAAPATGSVTNHADDTTTDESDESSTTNSTNPSLLVGGNSAGTANVTPSTASPSAAPTTAPQSGAGATAVSNLLLVVTMFAALAWS